MYTHPHMCKDCCHQETSLFTTRVLVGPTCPHKDKSMVSHVTKVTQIPFFSPYSQAQQHTGHYIFFT